MQEAIAYGMMMVTLGLVLSRPRIWMNFRLGPASAGILSFALLLVTGVVSGADIAAGFQALWRPFLTIISIMLTTNMAKRLGVLDHFARVLEPRRGQRVTSVFLSVFAFSAVTSAMLNNDAAVLLLTRLIVALVRRSYPDRPDLVIPFAFAVFSAAGVAPLVISNPMNLVVAEYAGIGFNEYAARMIPISVVGWIAAYLVLRLIFARELRSSGGERGTPIVRPGNLSRPAKQFLGLMVVALGCYPALAYAGGPVWAVATASAMLGLLLFWHGRIASLASLVRSVSWDILIFLFCVFVIVLGLRNVGLVDRIAGLYQSVDQPAVQILGIGVFSAVGSAVLNNHPMAILNALAIGELPGRTPEHVLAALIGGDLGPRLLPMGSLAGLLWLDSLRRVGAHVSLARFMVVGMSVTVPTLTLSLTVLLVGMAFR